LNAFFLRHKKLHLWLAADLLALSAFVLTRGNRAWMNALSDRVTAPVRRAVGSLCYRTDVSVMEVLCVLLAAFAVGYVLWSAAAVLHAAGRRLRRAYSALLGAVCIALTVYVGFCFLWGVNYYTDSFQDRSGIRAEAVSVEDLDAVTRYFAARLRETADTVERTQSGLFAVPRREILDESTGVYGDLDDAYPFLRFDDRVPKAVHFSRIMSRLDFTGVYCPYTGESNVNVDAPACLLPSTIAHELAHQRGIASEQECNFLSVLACTTCGKNDYAYSGWLLGYIHLGNALYKADKTRWKAVYSSLPASVRTDLTDNNAYWDQFRDSRVRKASNQVYDRFLKGYGESAGLQSYGTVVDLLVVYYKTAAYAAQ
jgi:hypothetical protein